MSDGGVAHLILIGVHAHNRFTGPAAMERIRALYVWMPSLSALYIHAGD